MIPRLITLITILAFRIMADLMAADLTAVVAGIIDLHMSRPPNNSPEPPPIVLPVPHSRLTDSVARLSFCR
jgi:hypothetical protein